MEAFAGGAVVLGLIFAYLGLGVWIFAALTAVSLTSLLLILGMPIDQVGAIFKGTMWRSANNWQLAAIPIFVWMGELIIRTNISERLFRGLTPWVELLPGGLLHTNVVGCTMFAAVSGSSAATTATVGKITTTALRNRGYDRRLAIGSLAGAGSLGLMIPPSIVFIVYGVLANESIAQLFAAGLVPGLLVAALFSGYIVVRALIDPAIAPTPQRRFTGRDRLHSLADLAPILILAVLVLGGIYTGITTPSEAAALGVATTFLIVIATGQLTWAAFRDSLQGTIVTTAMLVSILVAAALLSSTIAYLHIPSSIAAGIETLELGPYGLILVLVVFYLFLGLFLDGTSILVMSLPITLPLVEMQGWDPVWFGVFLVLMIEAAQVTPPIGFNLFVIQGLTGQPISEVALAAVPFFLLLLTACLIVVLLPDLVLWLPNLLYR